MKKFKGFITLIGSYTFKFTQHLLKTSDDQDSIKKIHQRIISDSYVTGANYIILFCAAIIASAGLNINSIPVIIGAMLISPLMGPILGIGYGLAIFNSLVIKNAFINLIKSIFFALIASIVFFFIIPSNAPTSEILARTSPSIFDILIALFGGIAGVIALTRTKKTNVIPGVAIATALMPPLCVIGYGIANFNVSIILGASYLFVINIVFIILATILIVKAMGITSKSYENYIKKQTFRTSIVLVILLVALPSIYSAFNTAITELHETRTVQYADYIQDNYDIKIVSIKEENDTISIKYYGDKLNEEEITNIENQKNEYKLSKYDVDMEQLTQEEVINNILDSTDYHIQY